jgi:hypothetical protein
MITEEQRNLCWDLVIHPLAREPRVSKEEFVRRFPSAVENGKLASGIFEAACCERSAKDLSYALIIGFKFGFAPRQLTCSPASSMPIGTTVTRIS